MKKYIVRKRVTIEYEWEVEAESKADAEALAYDLGEVNASVAPVRETPITARRTA